MTDLNTTASTMSKEELEIEYIHLKTNNQSLLKKIEEYEQQLYETKRQLVTSKLMEQELTLELEAIQSSGSSETEQLIKKIKSLEEEITNVNKVNLDNVNHFEQELNERNTEIESLRNKINDMSLAISSNDGNNEKIKNMIEELEEVKSKNDLLVYELEEQQYKNKDLSKENNHLENKISEISRELDDMKEFLGIKREELEASNERFTNLQDEFTITKMELDRIKLVPQDQNAKGNSLFAEVEDNRQQLKKYIKQMNKKYTEMKVSYNRKSTELQRIYGAYMSLKTQMKEDSNFENNKAELLKSYEDIIKNLKENFKALQEEFALRKKATAKILSGDQNSHEALIEISRKEILDLRAQMNQQQYLRFASEQTLFEESTELKKWRQEARLLQAEKLILTQKVEDLESKLSITESPSNSTVNSQDEEETSTKTINKKNISDSKTGDEKASNISNLPKDSNVSIPKYNIKPNKQEMNKFCEHRTLTVVENDLLYKSPDSKLSKPKYDIPDLSSNYACNHSFETFDEDLSINSYLPDSLKNDIQKPVVAEKNVSSILKNESAKPSLTQRNPLSEVNKDVEKGNVMEEEAGSSKMKRKVCFTEDTINDNENRLKGNSIPLRGGKILVPKKKIMLFSNPAKKV